MMPFLPSDSTLFAPLFTDAEMSALFSDEVYISSLLKVETTLAKVQAELGIIPLESAQKIQQATLQAIDIKTLSESTERDGFPMIGLLEQVRKHLDTEATSHLHWGATTQDIMDTALVLQLRDVVDLLERRLEQVIYKLSEFANKYRHTLMAGRTHSQQALPITFGYKTATWLAPLLRHKQRLYELKPRLLVVQFGGAVGTLASLGESGVLVTEALAKELNLNVPLTPWHTQRDNLAELANWLSLVTGSLAKMAQDIILLAQSEVAEVRESNDASRSGSSTMPQKSNPIVSELVIASARVNATLLSAMHQALIQEHERATHGWQLEWLTLPQMLSHTATALNKSSFLSKNLVVDEAQMLKNIQASRGLMMAEAVTFALAEHMPKAEAKRIVKESVAEVLQSKKHLLEVVKEKTNAVLEWEKLNEARYLGSTQTFIDQVLTKAKKV